MDVSRGGGARGSERGPRVPRAQVLQVLTDAEDLGISADSWRHRARPRRGVPHCQQAPLLVGGHGEAMKLEVRQLAKTYFGKKSIVPALSPTSFRVEEGAFVTLLGPSGCGKSTALQLIAGLEDATSGDILLDGVPVHGPGPERGMVFQS